MSSDQVALENLPSGKPHVSFSELREWQGCSYKHKLKFVDKITLDTPGPLLEFGKAVHSACENFLKSKVMDVNIAISLVEAAWPKYVGIKGFEPEALETFKKEIIAILAEVPGFLDETFPGWEFVDAEHQLYERLEKHPQHAFKGFIDAIIKVKDKRGEYIYWLLDWKTSSFGWVAAKKSDPKIQSQLVLYKTFWSPKTQIDMKAIRCGFVLLKRAAKPGRHCELVKVSVGPVTSGRSLGVINGMINHIKRGTALKNRESCTYCEFKGTEWCK